MHRPLPVVGQKSNRDQIEKPLDEARPAVLGFPPGSGMVFDGQLGNSKSLGGGEHRREAVQLAVEQNRVRDVAPIRLESTIEIVQFDAGGAAHGPVEDSTRSGFAERILAALLPA